MNTIRSVIAGLFRRLNAFFDGYIARRVDDINRVRGRADFFDVFPDDQFDLTERAEILLTADLIAAATVADFNAAAAQELTP